jgi:superfamily I DNA/RNA helicase
MFRLDNGGERHYVIHGVWPHDEAIRVANRLRLTVNPINGLPQFDESPENIPGDIQPESFSPGFKPPTKSVSIKQSLLESLGVSLEDLVDRMGIPEEVASKAMLAQDEDEILTLAAQLENEWVATILIDIAAGDPVTEVVEKMALAPATSSGDADADVLAALQRTGAQVQFAFIEDNEELRSAIEAADFAAWRVFLHPEQRRYVGLKTSGAYRISGGAGTGKTVVLVHRARELAKRYPANSILLTTYTTNLAGLLQEQLAQLDPRIRISETLGEPGVFVSGIDALAASVLRLGGASLPSAVERVLGQARETVNGRTSPSSWQSILDTAHTSLPGTIANSTFLTAEYSSVILPNRIISVDDYLHARRSGRGIPLNRTQRAAVWALIEAYRAQSRIAGTVDFFEAAAIATVLLEEAALERIFVSHALVDEGQDLSPTHWQMLRALVPPGADDLFIAEDSHQRIYGARVVLSRLGISIVGRSRRLTLNYRTTAQNLRYAMGILAGGTFVDLEDQPETTGYRSARSGPDPQIAEVASITEELDHLANVLRVWLDQGILAGTIAVLCPDRFQRDRLATGLTERGLPVRSVDRDRVPRDRIPVMTMHRAKGTEFSRVALAGVGERDTHQDLRISALDEADQIDEELRQKSLLYVAATRARDELVVIQRSTE